MIYISDRDIVNLFLKNIDDIDSFLKLLEVASFLVIKLWKKIYLDDVLKKIKDVNDDLHFVILILKKSGKLSYKNIVNIINYLKQQKIDRKKCFTVSSPSNEINIEVEKYLEEYFKNVDVDKRATQKLWLFVKWENYYYKRFLENDLEKLLG